MTEPETTTNTIRIWLVERTYSDDEQNLIILTYATGDGARYFRKERALTSFTDVRETTAAVDADPDNLGTVDDPDCANNTRPKHSEWPQNTNRTTRFEDGPLLEIELVSGGFNPLEEVGPECDRCDRGKREEAEIHDQRVRRGANQHGPEPVDAVRERVHVGEILYWAG